VDSGDRERLALEGEKVHEYAGDSSYQLSRLVEGFLTVALFYELSSTIITFFEENTTAHKAHVLLDPTHSPLRQTDQDRPAQVSGGVPKAG
jgi:hypothetical protein